MSDQNQIPELFNIPSGAIDRWVKIPDSAPVNVPLTRQDLDNLYFAINSLVNSNAALQESLVRFSNNQMQEADQAMVRSQVANTTALNRLRLLFNAIMSNAVPVKHDEG